MISMAVSPSSLRSAWLVAGFLLTGCAAVSDDDSDSPAGSADSLTQDEAAATSAPEIIDGEPSPESEDFVVRVDIRYRDGGQNLCSGSLIHPSIVLTAQHCLGRRLLVERDGNLGRYYWTRARRLDSVSVAFGRFGNRVVSVSHAAVPFDTTAVRHEVPAVYAEDLAILWLSTPVTDVQVAHLDGYTRSSTTDPLTNQNGVDLQDGDTGANSYSGLQFRVAGWGMLDTQRDATQRLSRVSRVAKKSIAALALSDEAASARIDFLVNSEQFSVLPGSICPGDSGGPAFDHVRTETRNGVPVLTGPWIVGVVSFGATNACTNPQDYVIYQRVRAFDDFFAGPPWRLLANF